MNNSELRKSSLIKTAALVVSFALLIGTALILGYTRADKVYADDNTYTTNSYYTHINVNEDNSFNVSENITVDFYYPHHGIYRYIPENGTSVSSVSVPDYEYDTYYENGNYVIQIGSGSYTLTGENEYDISYRLTAWDDETEEKDVLMLNLIPTGWQTDIHEAKAVIVLPKKTDLSSLEVFSGSYGSEGNEDNAEVEISEDGKTITVTAEELPVYHGITITADLPEGYFTGERVRGEITPGFIFLLILGPVLCLLLWFLYGRDDKLVKTIEFYPPDGLTPGEIGYIIDESADNCDIVSSIVYMANKGYLSIEEQKRSRFLLTKKSEPADSEPDYIVTIFNGLFAKTDSVYTDQLPKSFGTKFQRARDQLAAIFDIKSNGVKSRKADAMRKISMLACVLPGIAFGRLEAAAGTASEGILYFWTSLFIFIATVKACRLVDNMYSWDKKKVIRKALGIALFLFIAFVLPFESSDSVLTLMSDTKAIIIKAAVILATIVCVFLAGISDKTNPDYVRLMGRVLGFKEFIATAELDKLKELIEEDPEYFYSISPYAYVFGLSNKWIKNFENIPMTEPKWFDGSYRHMDSWDAYWMGRMMHDCSVSTINTVNRISIPDIPSGSGSGWSSGGGSSFSGGGFSGGGFSGGGMGGGGGGAW